MLTITSSDPQNDTLSTGNSPLLKDSIKKNYIKYVEDDNQTSLGGPNKKGKIKIRTKSRKQDGSIEGLPYAAYKESKYFS